MCNTASVEIKSLHDEWCALDGRRCTCSWAFLISFTLASVRSFTLVTCPKRTPSTLFCCSPSKVDAHHHHQARLEDAGAWVPHSAGCRVCCVADSSNLRSFKAPAGARPDFYSGTCSGECRHNCLHEYARGVVCGHRRKSHSTLPRQRHAHFKCARWLTPVCRTGCPPVHGSAKHCLFSISCGFEQHTCQRRRVGYPE